LRYNGIAKEVLHYERVKSTAAAKSGIYFCNLGGRSHPHISLEIILKMGYTVSIIIKERRFPMYYFWWIIELLCNLFMKG